MANASVEKLITEKELVYKRLEPLREQRKKIAELREGRDKLNDSVKALNEKIKKLKDERDSHNVQVKSAKGERDKINEELTAVRKEFTTKFPKVDGREPNFSKIKLDVENLRWSIETSGVSYEKEKELRGTLDKLEIVYNGMKKKEDLRRKMKELDRRAREHHNNVLAFSQKSEETHGELVVLYENVKEARAVADDKHQEVVTEIEKLNELEKKHAPDVNRFNELREKIGETKKVEVEKEKKATEKSIKERAEKAFDKFTSGKRVDLRELQLKFIEEEEKAKKTPDEKKEKPAKKTSTKKKGKASTKKKTSTKKAAKNGK